MTEHKRKFEWVDKWAKMTGERARIDAKANKTAIVYRTEKGWVREHYDGTIETINSEENGGGKMREKERINRIMSLLQRIWEQQPDIRFNQLISNLQHMYSSQNEGYGQRIMKEKGPLGDEVESSYLDLFYLEDDKWEEFLQRIVD
ncbi:hypothetical protein [Bacillus andreraoultii]|uniref:hypothetical protein n=1 Tax=Bacillus andreraoultii TaxID=1499685 RepID=UPI00053B47EE|nr:hypothetical protein [Bacillus andreraoultii]